MLNLVLAGVTLILLFWLAFSSDTREAFAFIFGAWLGVFLIVQLALGMTKLGDTDPRDYEKEAKALIEECEKALPRDQNCTIVMKAVAD